MQWVAGYPLGNRGLLKVPRGLEKYEVSQVVLALGSRDVGGGMALPGPDGDAEK